MKYRKKPVVIEAEQWDEERDALQDFKADDPRAYVVRHRNVGKFMINTLEGNHEVTDGDFIIRGVAGEHYPCKADIFKKTYERVV